MKRLEKLLNQHRATEFYSVHDVFAIDHEAREKAKKI
jgi:hypothetical protein